MSQSHRAVKRHEQLSRLVDSKHGILHFPCAKIQLKRRNDARTQWRGRVIDNKLCRFELVSAGRSRAISS